jgi:hypothetical protein
VLVLTPLLATWLVVEFLVNTLFRLGRPGASTFFTAIYRFSPEFAEGLSTPWVEYVIAVVLTLVMLYFLGWATTRVLGRRILGWFGALLERVPLVKTIYGGIKIFLAAFQTKPEGVERVVLINFPSLPIRRKPPVILLSKVPLCLSIIRQGLGSPWGSSDLTESFVLCDAIGNWLLDGLYMADELLERHFKTLVEARG